MLSSQVGGVTALVCRAADCGEIATVLVERQHSTEQPLCPEHWHAACSAVPGVLAVSRVLP